MCCFLNVFLAVGTAYVPLMSSSAIANNRRSSFRYDAASSGVLRTTTYYCLLLLTSTYYYLLLLTTTYFYLLLLTIAYYYLLLLISTYLYLLLLTTTYYYLLLLTYYYLLLLLIATNWACKSLYWAGSSAIARVWACLVILHLRCRSFMAYL